MTVAGLTWPLTAPRRRWAMRAAALTALVLLAIIADRLSSIPYARSFGLADRHLGVPVGHRIVLGGVAGGALLDVETPAGDGIQVKASEGIAAGSGVTGPLAWLVSSNANNKVRVAIGLAPERSAQLSTVTIQRIGDIAHPSLLIGASTVPLSVRGAVEFGEPWTAPAASLVSGDGTRSGAYAVDFTVPSGQTLALTLPAFAADKAVNIGVGSLDTAGSRLRVRQIDVTAEGERRPWWSACAAVPGRSLWAVLVRGYDGFLPRDCGAAEALAIDDLAIGPDTVTLALLGSAFVIGPQPVVSRYLEWVKNSPFGAVVLGVLMTMTATWLLKLVGRGEA